MASHFSTIGLGIGSEEELGQLAGRLGPSAEAVPYAVGTYFRWADPSGAEIWLQVNAENELVGLNPHFAGRSSLTVGLTARIPSTGPSELDGSFHGWASPGEGTDDGCYPFVFDAPDYRTHDERAVPGVYEVQVAAFAHEVEAFDTVEAYNAAQSDGRKFAVQSFIPSGLFAGEGEPARAEAIFTGHIREAGRRMNGLMHIPFYWAVVDTYGGMYDVVIDASLLPEPPRVGGVLSGSFWLTGRILGPARRATAG